MLASLEEMIVTKPTEKSLVAKIGNSGFLGRVSRYMRRISNRVTKYWKPAGCVTAATTLALLVGTAAKIAKAATYHDVKPEQSIKSPINNTKDTEDVYGNDIFVANTNTEENGHFIRAVIDNRGNFIVAWRDIGGPGLGLAQRFDRNGNRIEDEFLIADNGDAYNFDVAMASDGYHILTWRGIYAQRYDKNGNKIGGILNVGDGCEPSIAMNEEKEFVITYQALYRDDDGFGVFGQRFNKDGNKLGGEFQVNTYTPGEQQHPVVAKAPNGDFVVAWESGWGQDGSRFGIFAQRYDKNGNRLEGEFQVNTYTEDDQAYPNMAMDSQGNFIITWASGWRQEWEAYAQRFRNDGSRIGGEFQVNIDYPCGGGGYPSTAMDSEGNFAITWSSGWFGGEVYAQRFRNDGSRIGGEFQVNSYTIGEQYASRAAMNDNKDLIFTWGSGEGNSNEKVFAKIFHFYNPADLNKDGFVDFKDFAIFSDNWLERGP